MRILSGDIGGTNTRLSVWQRDNDETPRLIGEPRKFKNAGTASIDALLDQFLPTAGDGITDACFGVAGPVDGRHVRMTNIPQWPAIDADAIARRLNIAEPHRVNLINDMAAHAASLDAVDAIAPGSTITLRAGEPNPGGARTLVTPGTGLGIGGSLWHARTSLHRPVPTEAGHAELPARDPATAALIVSRRKLLTAGVAVTREHLISGRGMRALYACLKNPDSPNLDAAPAPEDLLKLESADPIAHATLDTFVKLLGELCGNLVFDYLATGGVFIAGNIAGTLRDRLASPLFTAPFLASGPASLKMLIEAVPVKLVTYAETGLLGAATYATWAAEKRV